MPLSRRTGFRRKKPSHGCPHCWNRSICRHRGKRMKRGTGPRRKKRMKRRNWTRWRERRRTQFGTSGKREWVVAQPCATCGEPPPSDPSHVKARGMGGTGSGPEWMVPMCRDCHRKLDTPGWGPERFQDEYDCDLEALAREYEARWRDERES